MEKEKQLAINELKQSSNLLVIVKNGQVQYKSKEKGVSAIIDLLDNRPDLLQEAVVADKVIGRAVAMVCDYARVKFCYGSVISESAVEILKKAEIPYEFGKKVEVIKNRDGTDLCPIEKRALKTEDSAEGIRMIKDFLK